MTMKGLGISPELTPASLEEALELIEAIYDADQAGIFIYSADGRLVECNRAACEMHGFSKEEMLGMEPKDFIHPDGYQTFLDFQRDLQRDGWFEGESCGRTAAGGKFDVEVYGKPITVGGEGYLYSAIRDVTEAKGYLRQILEYEAELESKVERRTTELAQSNRRLEEFAYLTSHDLQEPLRTIGSFVGVLQEDYASALGDEGREVLRFIADATDRMKRMIADLLDHGRLGQASTEASVDLEALVDEVIEDLGATIGEAGAAVHRAALPSVTGRPTELRLLFQNLIANAVKFRREGVPPRVDVAAVPQAGRLVVSVADNGIGLEARHAERIFQPFQRIHLRGTYEGTGIGLAHCRKIVELHGGSIRIESELGRGSTLIFDLPLA